MKTDPAASPAAAGARLLAVFAWVCVIALWPAGGWLWQAPSLVVLVALSWSWKLPLRPVLRRLGVVWLLASLMGVGLIGQRAWELRVANLFLKSTLSLWALSLLFHRLALPEVVAGLRWLRVPPLLTETVSFWGRYFSVLSGEWARLQLARRARTFTANRRLRFRALANALGLLFIRAYERAEKVHRAMLARGYRL